MSENPWKIAVLGAGSWGTALALLLADNGHEVFLWGRETQEMQHMKDARVNDSYLPGISFPHNLNVCLEIEEAVKPADDVLVVVPSQGFGEVLRTLKPLIKPTTGLLWGTKGLDSEGHWLHETVQQLFGADQKIAVVSGPSFAQEVAKRCPTALTIASPQKAFAEKLCKGFSNDYFRAYSSDDVIGVEVGGAMKNIMAVATGVCDGLGNGANARCALITRGLAEMMRVAKILGAQTNTLMGLAGVGDLILTCTDDQSRNRRFGLALGQGASVEEAKSRIGQVVEGAKAAFHMEKLSKHLNVELPITQAVCAVLRGDYSAKDAVEKLLSRPLKAE